MYKYLWMIAIPFFLTACGGGSSDGGSGEKTGIFIDSAVQGLNYECGKLSGTTDSKGTFKYNDSCNVVFSVGDIEIGSATGAPVITPVELVPGAEDESNDQVANIVSFLLTVDENSDPSDGIKISAAISKAAQGKTIDFSVPSNQFVVDGNIATIVAEITSVSGQSRSVVSSDAARSHLNSSLLTLYKGTYSGKFSGDDSGTWTFIIDENGNVSGSAKSSLNNENISISGTLNSNGTSEVTGTAGDSIFSGTFSRNGSVNGTWTNESDGDSGSFSGSRIDDKNTDPSNGNTKQNKMSISGSDAAVLGSVFAPEKANGGEFSPGNIQAVWTQQVGTDSTKGAINHMLVMVVLNGQLSSLSLTRMYSLSADGIYGYSVLCANDSNSCSGIIIDAENKKLTGEITLNANESDGQAGNNATGSINLNGTLYWN